jgi:hypothetical protein
MAPPLYGVDDPKVMNDFLAMIGASPLPLKEDVPKPKHPSFNGIPGSMVSSLSSLTSSPSIDGDIIVVFNLICP